MNRKHLSIMMIGLLLITGLAGCAGQKETVNSKTGGSNSPSLSYRENEISLPDLERVAKTALDSQEQLVAYDQAGLKSKFVICNKEGQQIKQIPCPTQAKEADYIDGSVFALDQRDNIYQLQQIEVFDKPNADEPSERIKRLQVYNASGQLEKTIELGRNTAQNLMNASHMVADKKGQLYILYWDGKIEIINQAGKSIKTITGAKYHYMDLDKAGNLVLVGRDGSDNYLARLDSNGKTIWKQKLDGIKMAPLAFKYNAYDGCYYIADYSGIKKYDPAGNYKEEILNYRSTSIFVSDVLINGLNISRTGEIYIDLIYNGGSSASGKGFSVFRYTPDKAGAHPSAPSHTITLAVADPDLALTLEKGARLYQKKHPNIEVEIKDYSSGQVRHRDPARYESYVKTINTEILSGRGPDIISLQGLPYGKYIDKKVLVDLKPLMKKDKTLKRQDYYTNILTACEHRGKLYGMPISFNLPVIIADGTMLEKANISINDDRWTWSDFYAAAKKITQDTNNDGKPETYALPAISTDRILDYMLASDYRSLVDENKKQAHFDSARFTKFLKTYKDLTSTLMNSRIEQGSLIFTGNRSSIAFELDQTFFGDMSFAKCEMGAKAKVLDLPQGIGPRDRSFNAEMLAISQNSQQQKEAWEFLKFLTRADTQRNLQLYGLMINRRAQDQSFAAQAKEKGGLCTIGDGQHTKTLVQEPLSPEQIAQTRQLIAGLNHCSNIDPQIRKIIDTELAAFLKGEKSAAETARVLQNKVTLYLNE